MFGFVTHCKLCVLFMVHCHVICVFKMCFFLCFASLVYLVMNVHVICSYLCHCSHFTLFSSHVAYFYICYIWFFWLCYL